MYCHSSKNICIEYTKLMIYYNQFNSSMHNEYIAIHQNTSIYSIHNQFMFIENPHLHNAKFALSFIFFYRFVYICMPFCMSG